MPIKNDSLLKSLEEKNILITSYEKVINEKIAIANDLVKKDSLKSIEIEKLKSKKYETVKNIDKLDDNDVIKLLSDHVNNK